MVVLLIATLGGGDGQDIMRARGADDSLAYQFLTEGRKLPAATAGEDKGPAARRSFRRAPRESGGILPVPVLGDEVALGPRGDAPRPLDGEDLIAVHNRNQAGLQLCFNRALKADPFLKIPKVTVAISVGLSGQVDRVVIPALAQSSLGACLEQAVRRWRFPATTEVFNTQFPVVFSSR
jgi:hypothetical protein